LNKSKVVGSQLVVAHRNPTAWLDPVKKTLDPVAVAVAMGLKQIGSLRLRYAP